MGFYIWGIGDGDYNGQGDQWDCYETSTGIDYIGFEIPQEYVVGYGLDYEQKMRHLDSIYKIKNDLID